jgi:hypothetical protein
MNVRELIEELERLPPECEIFAMASFDPRQRGLIFAFNLETALVSDDADKQVFCVAPLGTFAALKRAKEATPTT